jgi:hypothetical protein
MQKILWFCSGLLIGQMILSVSKASVPHSGAVIDQRLSEIRVPKAGKSDFDASIRELVQEESRYKEKLPSFGEKSRLEGPLKRIAEKPYRR